MDYYSELEPIAYMTAAETKEAIKTNLVNGQRLYKGVSKYDFASKRSLEKLYHSIRFHCGDLNIRLPQACHVVLNGPAICSICGGQPSFINFKKGFNPYCSRACCAEGKKGRPIVWSPEGREARSLKLSRARKGLSFNAEWKKKLSEAANREEVKAKKRATCFERYGVENPGVMGAYSSAAARRYIETFIQDRGIDPARCMYHTEDTSEFFKMVRCDGSDKMRYISYDLVVFKDLGHQEIDLVLEYQGPWHYRLNDVASRGESPSTPYPNAPTIAESYELDVLKRETIRLSWPSATYLTFWERDNELIEV